MDDPIRLHFPFCRALAVHPMYSVMAQKSTHTKYGMLLSMDTNSKKVFEYEHDFENGQ